MIEGLKELGKTVFLTTHYMDEAEHLADRVAILREGRIVAQGPMSELERQPRPPHRDRLPAQRRPRPPKRCAPASPPRSRSPAARSASRPSSRRRDLYRLLALAEERGVTLDDLEVRKPSLEDIFLDLTRDARSGEP